MLQHTGRRRVSRRHRPVVGLLCSHDQPLCVFCIEEEAATLPIQKLLNHLVRPAGCPVQIIGPERHTVKLQKSQAIAGVVIQLSLPGGFPVPVTDQQASVPYKRRTDKFFRTDCPIHIFCLPEHRSGLCAGAYHPSVPGNQYLIILMEPRPFEAVSIQLLIYLIRFSAAFTPAVLFLSSGPLLTNAFIRFVAKEIWNAFSLKIARPGNPIVPAERFSLLCSKNFVYFLRGEDVILSLHSVTVRILAAVESSLWVRKLGFYIFENHFCRTPV